MADENDEKPDNLFDFVSESLSKLTNFFSEVKEKRKRVDPDVEDDD